MAHYRQVKSWCELILSRQMPLSLLGLWKGISLLFPMEKLFERYVASMLKKTLVSGARLVTQAASQSLCEHNAKPMFRLRPDLLVEHGDRRWVLDTKWKLLDAQDQGNNYGLSQSDFYQLYAYGKKYLAGCGELVLIYPKRKSFFEPLSVFEFNPDLRLWALPFDIESARLIDRQLTTLPLQVCMSTG